MRKLRTPLIVFLLTFLSCSSLWASKVDDLVAPAVERLDYKFFYWLFDEEGLTQAYALAQEEDFEAGAKVLFTDKMLSLFKIPQRNWEDKLGDLSELWYLEEELKTLDAKVSTEAIQKWRYAYLQKMMDFIREKANRKPLLRFMAMSSTSYNTNIERIDDNQLNAGAFTNEDDGQQMLLFNAKWMPLANDKSFSKNNKFSQSFNLIQIHQFRHKRNQVAIFDTESKWTRKLEGKLDDMSLAYRFQNFGLSGDQMSRDTHAKFYTHRIKGDLSLKRVPLSGGMKSTKSDFSLTYILKKQFNDVDLIPDDKDATDVRLEGKQSVSYAFSGKDGTASVKLQYVTYDNDDWAAGDYKYWTLTLDNKNKFMVPGLKEALRLSEQFAFRTKSWDQPVAASPEDETLMSFSLKASTRLAKSWDSYLSLKQTWRDRDLSGGSKTDAKQTEFTLGFIWSTP